jgi:hypothetical protein
LKTSSKFCTASIDTSTTAGEAMFQMLGVFAEFEPMFSVQLPVVFLGRPVIGRNDDEAGKGDHVEQE